MAQSKQYKEAKKLVRKQKYKLEKTFARVQGLVTPKKQRRKKSALEKATEAASSATLGGASTERNPPAVAQ